MNNSIGPENNSGAWWGVIKGYADLNPHHLVILEEIINSTEDEELRELMDRLIEVYNEEDYYLHITHAITSGGATGVGATEETPLTDKEVLELNSYTKKVAEGIPLSHEETKRQKDLLDNSGQVMQENSDLTQNHVFFALAEYPGLEILAGPVTITLQRPTGYGMMNGPQFKQQLRRALDNA